MPLLCFRIIFADTLRHANCKRLSVGLQGFKCKLQSWKALPPTLEDAMLPRSHRAI